MDDINVKKLIETEFSPDVLTKLSNIINLDCLEDFMCCYNRIRKLKKIYDCLSNIISHLKTFGDTFSQCCQFCSETNKSNSYDTIDGICPCKILKQNKNDLEMYIKFFEDSDYTLYE